MRISNLVQSIIRINFLSVTSVTFMTTDDSNWNKLLHIILQENKRKPLSKQHVWKIQNTSTEQSWQQSEINHCLFFKFYNSPEILQ